MNKNVLGVLVMGVIGLATLAGCTPTQSASIACDMKLDNDSDEQACKWGVAIADEIGTAYAKKHSLLGIVWYPSHSEAMRMRDTAIKRCYNGYADQSQKEACVFGIDEYIESLAASERSSND